MKRILLSLVLAAHGLIHLLGFVVNWQLAALAEMPYKTILLAGLLDVGEAGIRAVGVLWLLAAVGFAIAGVALLARRRWWRALALWVTPFSLALCILGWPDSQFGLWVNLGLLIYLFLGGGRRWSLEHRRTVLSVTGGRGLS